MKYSITPCGKMRSLLVRSCVFGVMSMLLSLNAVLAAGSPAGYSVRVMVDDETPLVKISSVEPTAYQLRKPFTLEPVIQVPQSRMVVIRPSSEGLEVNGVLFKIAGIVVEPVGASSVKVNGRIYQGMIGVVRKNAYSLQLLNILDLEEYLAKVVGNEMPKDWPDEALKVQAIISRTYVLSRMRNNLYADYDVTASTKDQVADLNGKSPESVKRAVGQTRGMVLLYRGDIFPAYFHSTCGGRTKNAAWYWEAEDIEPLRGVACHKCSQSPFFRWNKEFTKSEFVCAVRQKGIAIANLSSVAVRPSSREGKEMIFNRTQHISTYRLRTLLGDSYLRSPDFDAEYDGSRIYINGKGWGHGAGLCQWGTKRLAEEGKKALFILQWYYPGSVLGVLEEYAS